MLPKIIRSSSARRCITNKLTCGTFTTSSKVNNEEDECECDPKPRDNPRDPVLFNPKCKVALISGGISGIGFAIATELLCAGMKHVFVTGTDACQGKEAQTMLSNTFGSTKSTFIKSNVMDLNSFEDAFRKVKDKFGQLDVFVNSAGILDGKHWEKEFNTNVVGTVRGTLLGFKYIGVEGGGHGGCIINISGIPGGFEPSPAAPTLAACWHAIIGFSRSMGHEMNCAKPKIRLMTLCPGFTRTDFMKRLKAKGMTEDMGRELAAMVKCSKKQKADVCGRAALHLIECARTGTVWWIEGSRLFSLKFPDRTCYSTLEAQYL